jgi:hypothetical protein
LKVGTDFAVPLPRNRDMLRVCRETLERKFPGKYVIFGHIGDAHVHIYVLPEGPAEAARARELITAFVTESGGYGRQDAAEQRLGKRKAHLLSIVYSAEELAAFQSVKTGWTRRACLALQSMRHSSIPVAPAMKTRVVPTSIKAAAGWIRPST